MKGFFHDAKPAVIAGPCSVESPEQLEKTVSEIVQGGRVQAIRAGIWKPRTRPNSFEGIGEKALPWLMEVCNRHGLPVATEVANGKHVELCLKHEVPILWIGARTSVNPFSVQEIADALKGVDIPIMVKNPVNPDLQLWIGGIERIQNAGITEVAAVHRGFSFYGESDYRNLPKWEIPIELKRLKPEIPLLCDPSHIGGSRELIEPICQKAMDLNFDGLMIESHFDPDNALSDAGQQLRPGELNDILGRLVIRSENANDPEFVAKLSELRDMIDEIDQELLEKFMDRMRIAAEIGVFKRDKSVTILKLRRWDQIIRDRIARGGEIGLDEEFVNQIMQLIHKESIRIQNEIMNENRDAEV